MNAREERLRLAYQSARERAEVYGQAIQRHVADRDTWKGWAKAAEAEVQRLRAERHSTNEALSDAAEQLRVQRDRIAELETAAVCPSVARLHGSKCVLPIRHGGDHRNETKRHYWSDEYAASVPQPRQAEDPHDSPLHHDYADSRDLPIPRQVTGRCPKCNGTFEDCTCGGAA